MKLYSVIHQTTFPSIFPSTLKNPLVLTTLLSMLRGQLTREYSAVPWLVRMVLTKPCKIQGITSNNIIRYNSSQLFGWNLDLHALCSLTWDSNTRLKQYDLYNFTHFSITCHDIYASFAKLLVSQSGLSENSVLFEDHNDNRKMISSVLLKTCLKSTTEWTY